MAQVRRPCASRVRKPCAREMMIVDRTEEPPRHCLSCLIRGEADGHTSASPRTCDGAIQFLIVLSNPPFEIGLAKWAGAVARYASGRLQALGCPVSFAIRRRRDIVDLPDLAGEADHVGCVPDEFHRGRLVQARDDDRCGAIRVDLEERAGVRLGRRPFIGTIPVALGEGVERIAKAKFHIHE
jgi:hypothetical protein